MNILNHLTIFLIHIYQKTLSPDKGLLSPWLRGRVCTHHPHCSEYAIQCFRHYPFHRAFLYTFERVMSCTPSHSIKHDPSIYRVVFASGSPIGVPFLEVLMDDDRYEVVGVMCPPDKSVGRGQKIRENIIKKRYKELKENTSSDDLIQPRSFRIHSKKYAEDAQHAHSRLEEKKPDFLVVVAYGYILPQSILDIPAIAPINVHGSLLPLYRGASPIQTVFLDQQQESGITIMLMSAGMDEGDMISKIKTKLPLHRTATDLMYRMMDQGPQHLVDSIRNYGKGIYISTAQDDTKATHCGKINKEDGLVDPRSDDISSIYSKYQAYHMRPKIYFIYHDKRVILDSLTLDVTSYTQLSPGLLISDTYTLHPHIKELKVKPEGKKSMTRESFVHGWMRGTLNTFHMKKAS